jgi:hypothetical protein
MPGGEVEHLGGDDPQIYHVHAQVGQALDGGPLHGLARRADIAAHGDGLRAHHPRERLGDDIGELFVDNLRVDSPDIVGAIKRWIERHGGFFL